MKPKAEEKQFKGGKDKVLQNSVKPINIQKEVAKIAKTSHDTVSKVKYLLENADKETIDKLEYGNKETSINQAYNNVKKKKKREKDSYSSVKSILRFEPVKEVSSE